MTRQADRSVPLYLQIAHKLERRIHDGTYPVGSLLPTESDLCSAFEVSRHTIRQAIEQLKRTGVLSARKGVGTRVESRGADWRNRFRSHYRHDLFDFSQESELRIDRSGDVVLSAAQAREMGTSSGKSFFYAAGPRYFAGESEPFCWNEVFLDESVAEILRGIDVLRQALFEMVERYTGERIASIQQDIMPVTIDEEKCRLLGVEPGALALRMTRRYLSSGGRLLEYAVQTLPADRFRYRTILSSGQPDRSDADGS
ncbi:GntR family transcriptional regulator [Palleronia sp. LCG004]|uniref:GntR family transcriptional regulator n=1 Tax=Palleronia sp. LCG004 TaxID=3079304 RepID=UPI00294340BD|nr:GntR family transcriptional regulator [Palleronia sp. LCG004]WOI58022.1 GntR family transcriptional regulator [Palleronia sp. LCG004]